MTHDGSLLLERVDRLLEGSAVRAPAMSWKLRGGVLAALLAAAHVLPGCDQRRLHGPGRSVTISLSDGETSVKVRRSGYWLQLEASGATTFNADESDLATLAPGGEFELEEIFEGVEHLYTVTADRDGVLTRRLQREGEEVALDDAGRRWLAAALPRMFRESGYDARARVARLLASGGPAQVLAELELTVGDHARGPILGELFDAAELDGEELARALACAGEIDSSYELHHALLRALAAPSLDGPGHVLVLETAARIESDSELASLLIAALGHLPAAARPAWLAAASEIDSDFELGRVLAAGLEHGDAPFVAELLSLAGEGMDSSSELAEVLDQAAARATTPSLAAGYLAAARGIDSNSARASALLALLDAARLDPASLGMVLDVTAGIASHFERGRVLKALAASVAGEEALSLRYREVASSLSSFERDEALAALERAKD